MHILYDNWYIVLGGVVDNSSGLGLGYQFHCVH